MVHARYFRTFKVPSRFLLIATTATWCLAVAFPATRSLADDVSPRLTAWSGPDTVAPAKWVDDLKAIKTSDWNYDRAAHLLERAGFSGTPDDIERLAAMTPQQAVDYLVDYESIPEDFAPFNPSLAWDEGMYADADRHLEFFEGIRRGYDVGELYGVKPLQSGERPYQELVVKSAFKILGSGREWQRMATWWTNRMVETPRPLEEKMTLFWHGHFANEELKLYDYRLMFNQNKTFRRRATGNFRDMLVAISQDPAMLVYLDNRSNVKGHANENYAREIMELFALGVGNYTEGDIQEAGRALTGWRNEGLLFINDPILHDEDPKTIFGKTGNFDGYDLIDLILEEEACAEWVSRKLFRYFVREDLSPELNAELASVLRDNNYEIKPLLKAIFLSRDFYSQASVGTQIKAPVHYYVSACRRLGLKELPGTPNYGDTMAGLGQVLGNPPNVKGWDGGRAWINPSTLLQRANLMRQVLNSRTVGKISTSAGDRYEQYANKINRPEGTWDISVMAVGQASAASLIIAKEGDEYSGTLVYLGEHEVSDVTYNESELSFTWEVASMGTVNFTATIEGDSLDGKFVIAQAGVELPTTGTRAEETPTNESGETMADTGDASEGEGSMGMMEAAPAFAEISDLRDYDLVGAVGTAAGLSYSRIKPTPTTPADLDIVEMVRSAGVETADDAVDYFIHRFLRVKLDEADRQLIISYMKQLSGGEKIDYESSEAEGDLRELLHTILSTPEFQLS